MRPHHLALFGRGFTAVPSWTCTTSKNFFRATQPCRNYSSTPPSVRLLRQKKPFRNVYWAAAGSATLGGGIIFGDEIKYAYQAVERSIRVVRTLYLNVKEYQTLQSKHFDDPAEEETIWAETHKRCADRTYGVLEKNGSIFIKMGQHLSAMGYLLPSEWTTTFIPLQDHCPVSSYESVEMMYLKDTGRRIEDDFDDFTKQPVGVASLAQVHTALMKGSNQKVAVKMQHPDLEGLVPLDLALTRFTFTTLKTAFPAYDLTFLSDEIELSIPQELDFAREAQNAIKAREWFSKNTNFPLLIPKVVSASRRILVMDYERGTRIDNLSYLDENHISRSEVSATLANIFNVMIFRSGAPLHCDPHGGNIAIRARPERRYPYNFELILYDHGLYRWPDDKLRVDYARLWLAVIDNDEPKMRKYAYEVAGITDAQFGLFASAITGRDYGVIKDIDITTTARGESEKEELNKKLGESLIKRLVSLLGTVPNIILLILKTNDETRSLDESLQSPEGPMRPMMILAKHASATVWAEEKALIKRRGSLFRPRIFALYLQAWLRFARIDLQLFFYERYLSIRRHLGIK